MFNIYAFLPAVLVTEKCYLKKKINGCFHLFVSTVDLFLINFITPNFTVSQHFS
jgi:hypothetical protein